MGYLGSTTSSSDSRTALGTSQAPRAGVSYLPVARAAVVGTPAPVKGRGVQHVVPTVAMPSMVAWYVANKAVNEGRAKKPYRVSMRKTRMFPDRSALDNLLLVPGVGRKGARKLLAMAGISPEVRWSEVPYNVGEMRSGELSDLTRSAKRRYMRRAPLAVSVSGGGYLPTSPKKALMIKELEGWFMARHDANGWDHVPGVKAGRDAVDPRKKAKADAAARVAEAKALVVRKARRVARREKASGEAAARIKAKEWRARRGKLRDMEDTPAGNHGAPTGNTLELLRLEYGDGLADRLTSGTISLGDVYRAKGLAPKATMTLSEGGLPEGTEVSNRGVAAPMAQGFIFDKDVKTIPMVKLENGTWQSRHTYSWLTKDRDIEEMHVIHKGNTNYYMPTVVERRAGVKPFRREGPLPAELKGTHPSKGKVNPGKFAVAAAAWREARMAAKGAAQASKGKG